MTSHPRGPTGLPQSQAWSRHPGLPQAEALDQRARAILPLARGGDQWLMSLLGEQVQEAGPGGLHRGIRGALRVH